MDEMKFLKHLLYRENLSMADAEKVLAHIKNRDKVEPKKQEIEMYKRYLLKNIDD